MSLNDPKNDPLKNWQLENRGEPLDQWKLQEAEQDLTRHLQLQPDEAGKQAWQPVEYKRVPGKRQTGWILPSVVIVALLLAMGYVAWISLGQFDLGTIPLGPFSLGTSQSTPRFFGAPAEMNPEETAVAVAPTEAPTVAPPAASAVAPTVTSVPEAPPTNTPEPGLAPQLVIDRIVGTANADGGVNARSEPALTGLAITLVNQGERVVVVNEQGEWLQVVLADGRAAWVLGTFFDRTTETVPLEEQNQLLQGAGLPLLDSSAGRPAGTAADAVPPVAVTTAITSVELLTGTPVSLVVIGDPGVTVRITPTLTAAQVATAPLSTTLSAIGRSEDGDWYLVRTADNQLGWVAAEFVTPQGDVAGLSSADSEIVVGPQGVAATPVEPGRGLLISPIVPQAPYTNVLTVAGPAIAISDTVGVNARATPTTTGTLIETIPNGAVLAVRGRTADGGWLQVELPNAQLAWVAREVVNVSNDVDTAPVIGAEEPAVTATPDQAPAASGAVATVSSLLGAMIRPQPDANAADLQVVDRGATLPATGRTADSAWVQVTQTNGTPGWIRAEAVSLNVDLASLPVVP